MLVAASQQNYYLPSLLFVIHPIAGSIINPQLSNAFTYRLNISRISSRQSFYPDKDSSTCTDVMQPIEPFSEKFSLADFNHDHSVAMWLHVVNKNTVVLCN